MLYIYDRFTKLDVKCRQCYDLLVANYNTLEHITLFKETEINLSVW